MSHRIPHILGQAKPLRKEHECAGEEVVQLAMSVPVLAVLEVCRAVVWLRAVGVLHHSVEDVADDGSRGKRGIRRAREDIVEPAGFLLSALVESFFGAGQMGGNLYR